ncbi:Rv3235 family protein [Glycomyces sp. L485]|uniref:Rv3235 family protein n=1 Tax=Glycomyces sp. L485 TaxID=2909235 RepID=UPI001F4A99EF|nr:Rv3235 family protein [Glycomyces sp. L485]MCH7229407.1 Rv3235 family protein [Glycomyces sp. L485]
MTCNEQQRVPAPRVSPRQAAGFSCQFLNVLAGRRPALDLERYATPRGWAAFCRVRRQIPNRLSETRIRRMSCPTEHTAELVALIGDGRTRRAMTLTFRLVREGWRLDDCAVLTVDHNRRRRLGAPA